MKLLIIFAITTFILCIAKPPKIVFFAQSKNKDSLMFVANEIPKLLNHPSKDSLFTSIKVVWAGTITERSGSIEGDRKFNGKDDDCYGNLLFNSYQNMYYLDEWEFFSCVASIIIEEFNFEDKNLNFNLYATLCVPRSRDFLRLLEIAKDKTRGPEYLHNAVISTPDLRSEYDRRAPYFYFDGKHNKTYNDEIKKDSVKFLCKYTDNIGKVPGC